MARESYRVVFNPALLTWARESAGYGVDEIARSADVRRERVIDWEEGTAHPTYAQLERVAAKCHRPLAAFFLPNPPREVPPPADFRLFPDTGPARYSAETLLAFREARRLQALGRGLVALAERRTKTGLPPLALSTDPELAGESIRRWLGVSVEAQLKWSGPRAAIWGWRDALEARGILTLQLSMPVEDARGFSLPDATLPVLVMNSRDVVQDRSFTLFHELGHVLLDEGAVCFPGSSVLPRDTGKTSTVEVICNRLAAAILLPLWMPPVSAALSHIPGPSGVSQEELVAVARRFKVSRDVVLRRLLTARFINMAEYGRMSEQWAVDRGNSPPPVPDSGGPTPPVRCLSERGRAFVGAVLDALDTGQLPAHDAIDYLGLRLRHFDALRAGLARAQDG